MTTARAINSAILASTLGKSGKYVLATVEGQNKVHRIIRARTRKGDLFVQILSTGAWIRPVRVWEE